MATTTDVSVRQGTVSSDISQLAYALLARERVPLTTLQSRLSDLNQRSAVLSALRTRLSSLHDEAQTLARTGTLSPFAAKAASASDTSILSASATSTAAPATASITVG